ncbi:MAG: ClbS/DfsB family four-helix bundle protein [Anaerolineales bacterium]
MIPTPTNMPELLNQIQQEWDRLLAMVSALTPDQMDARDAGGWSIKDNLAHLAEWENYLARHYLGSKAAHVAMGIDANTFARLDEDGLNAILHARNSGHPAPAVLALLREAHAKTLVALERYTFADLLTPRIPDGDPDDTLLAKVIGNTSAHYSEHGASIAAILGAS